MPASAKNRIRLECDLTGFVPVFSLLSTGRGEERTGEEVSSRCAGPSLYIRDRGRRAAPLYEAVAAIPRGGTGALPERCSI